MQAPIPPTYTHVTALSANSSLYTPILCINCKATNHKGNSYEFSSYTTAKAYTADRRKQGNDGANVPTV